MPLSHTHSSILISFCHSLSLSVSLSLTQCFNLVPPVNWCLTCVLSLSLLSVIFCCHWFSLCLCFAFFLSLCNCFIARAPITRSYSLSLFREKWKTKEGKRERERERERYMCLYKYVHRWINRLIVRQIGRYVEREGERKRYRSKPIEETLLGWLWVSRNYLGRTKNHIQNNESYHVHAWYVEGCSGWEVLSLPL